MCVRLLASKNLPAAIEDTGGNELPESIREKANVVKTQGGVGTVETKLYALPELLQRNKEILTEVSLGFLKSGCGREGVAYGCVPCRPVRCLRKRNVKILSSETGSRTSGRGKSLAN